MSQSPHIGHVYTTNIYNPQQSPTQIGSKESTQNVVFNEGQIAELQKILSKIEQITKDKAGEISPENRAEVESDVRDIKQELAKPNRDNSRILSIFRSLGNKIKDLTPYAALATQLLILLSSFSNKTSSN